MHMGLYPHINVPGYNFNSERGVFLRKLANCGQNKALSSAFHGGVKVSTGIERSDKQAQAGGNPV